jgi:hypothetical protein
MKKNPCDQCLVKSCCTEWCKPKNEYTDENLDFLTRLCTIIYKNNGKKRRNISTEVKNAHEQALNVCEENKVELALILKRYVNSVCQ